MIVGPVVRAIAFGFALVSLSASGANAASEFRDCSACPVMVSIAPGAFVIGAKDGEEEGERLPPARRGWSTPRREVKIAYAFALGKYDVTRAEFAAFVAETGYDVLGRCDMLGIQLRRVLGLDWRRPGFTQTDSDPVTCVSWDDSKAYTAWLAKKTGRPYRLASDAEWEYAARAGTATLRYWGDSVAETCVSANVADASAVHAGSMAHESPYDFECNDGYAYTSPSGAFKPNAFGLYDMMGNMWQWVEDCWNENYKGAPSDGSAMMAGDCSKHSERGGSWASHPRSIRSAYRIPDDHDNRSNDSGFRVALTVP